MHQTCQGTEIEFAAVPAAKDNVAPAALALADAVRSRFAVALDGSFHHVGLSMFLSNGARFYVDCGLHPECATPECASPLDLVTWEKACERIVEQACLAASESLRREVSAFKNNLDYLELTTWGCHESLLYRPSVVSPRCLQERLTPFLATRCIYAGAGAVSAALEGQGIELSARARFLEHSCSSDSTHDRGIWHTKDDPLCGGDYARLHNLSGDSLLSEFGIYLRAGTFALLAAALAAGCEVGQGLALRNPVAAMRAASADYSGQTRLDLADGRQLSALEIQRAYLRQARPLAQSAGAPAWMADICAKWEFVLDAIAHESPALCHLLDAHAKRAVYGEWLARRGVEWSALRDWAHVIETIVRRLQGALRVEAGAVRAQVRDAIAAADFARVDAFVRRRNMNWDDLLPMFQVYRDLQELDVRYSCVRRDASGYHALRRAGYMQDQLVSEAQIERAMHEPPQGTRAKARGEAIRNCSGHNACANWDYVCLDDKILRLPDPFSAAAEWEVLGQAAAGPAGPEDWLHRFMSPRRRRLRTTRPRHPLSTEGDPDVRSRSLPDPGT